MTRTLRLIPVLLVLALCAGLAAAGEKGLAGKVKKKVYYPPAKNFSVRVPSGPGMQVTDSCSQNFEEGAVSFHDDFGSLKSIHYMGMTDEELRYVQDATTGMKALQQWLHMVAMPTCFQPVSPDSTVLRETTSTFKGMKAVVALVEIPGGSVLTDANTGRRYDSRRGVVIFLRGRYIYMLGTETLGLFSALEGPGEVGESWGSFTKALESFYDTIKFLDEGQ